MPRVLRPDEKLAKLVKPSLEPASTIKLESEDCYILCVGFEDRAIAGLKKAMEVSSNFRVVLIDYLPFVEENRTSEISEICSSADLKVEHITYDRQNPSGFGQILLETTKNLKGRIFLDVSPMSRLLIVQCIVALARREMCLQNCTIVYSEASIYPPSKAEYDEAQGLSEEDPTFSILLLSSGIFDVTIVPELSSTAVAGTQTRLVAFPTFSADQFTALRSELQPSRYVLINGVPPKKENKWRTDAIKRINHVNSIDSEQCHCSTFDYRETLKCLLEIYDKYAERERLIISPTGSKMQAFAIGLFRAFMNDVQIVYPTPKTFRRPNEYTKGAGQIYTIDLDGFVV